MKREENYAILSYKLGLLFVGGCGLISLSHQTIICKSSLHKYHGITASLTVSTAFVYAVPPTPIPNICAEYGRTIGTLQTIESTWNEVVCIYVVPYIRS